MTQIGITKWVRNVCLMIGYRWHEHQDYLVKEQDQNFPLSPIVALNYLELAYINGQCIDIVIRMREYKGRLFDNYALQNDLSYRLMGRHEYLHDQQNQEAAEAAHKLIMQVFPNIAIVNKPTWCSACHRYCICKKAEDDNVDVWTCSTCDQKAKGLNAFGGKSATEPGMVYVFGNEELGYMKIGHSNNPKNRMSAYAPLLPFDIALICVIPADDKREGESVLHSNFQSKRLKGEWFALSGEDLAWLNSLDKFECGQFHKRDE